MLLITIATATLALPAVAHPTAGDHGELPWFEGSYEELMAKAREEQKLVFLDFWTSW